MNSKKRRLGVFGGSFDPPHGGHLHAARCAAQAFQLDHVLFVPAARPPHKPGRNLASGAHRVALLERLLEGEPGVSIDPRELAREGPSYTVDTLAELAGESELFLILGTDNLAGLPKWFQLERIFELAQPIVIHRAGEREQHLKGLEAQLSPPQLKRLARGFVEWPPVTVSSTDLRSAVRAGSGPGEHLPPALEQYIREHGLYRGDE